MSASSAFFISAPGPDSGRRFCIFHPAQGETLRGGIVYVHPFAEEMNKARRMAALQAKKLAQAGYAVLQIDLQGCGDSSCDFGDASWEGWIEDVLEAARWLQVRCPAPLWLWGLRAGCLLAAEAARRLLGGCHLLFWAPPPAGRLLLQQFLRLKAAGELLGGQAKAAAQELRRQRAAGLPIEVAGYTLAPALADGLEGATLAPPPIAAPQGPLAGPGSLRVVWLELSQREEPALSAASASCIAAWQQAGHRVQARAVRGPAFWQSAEIETAPALLDATLATLAAPDPAPAPAPARSASLVGDAASPAPPFPAGAESREEPLIFGCEGESLFGIFHRPAGPIPDTAVVVLVGGPQYRVGSHRQFVLLARRLADAGHPVLRFDTRGMGDGSGEHPGFEGIAPDIAAALDALQRRHPQIRKVVLWGLCDGASAALLYLHDTGDRRVGGLCLANPWVRHAASLARTHVKHYYGQRLLRPDFWRKLLSGRVGWESVSGMVRTLLVAGARPGDPQAGSFQQRMARAWRSFDGPILLLLSGEDYTAKEFLEHAARDGAWAGLTASPRVEFVDLPGADHTFSGPGQCADASRRTLAWLRPVRPRDEVGAMPRTRVATME